MAYTKQVWQDHYETEDEGIIQQGTPIDAKHMNYMEEGIYEANRVVVYYDGDGYLCIDAENAPVESE